MGQKRKKRLATFNSNATTVMSVALVLVLLGMVAVLAMAGRNLTNGVKEDIGFDVVLQGEATEAQIAGLKQLWSRQPYTASAKYISKEAALRQWEQETGEDLMEITGVNPLSAEFEVRVKAEYACSDSLNVIERQLRRLPAVESVQMHKDIVEALNKNISQVVMILAVVAIVLLIISFALINNTVHLTIYSRRFLIHTMKLVGATPGFIRRPIVIANALNGIVASLIAMAVLSAAIYYVVEFEAGWSTLIQWMDVAIIYGALLVFGTVICAIAAAISATRFIGLDYDDLFMK